MVTCRKRQGKDYFRVHGRHQGMRSEEDAVAMWLAFGVFSMLGGLAILLAAWWYR